MLKLPEIPKLPEKEELEYKEKAFLLALYEEFRGSSKALLYTAVVLIFLAVPLKFGLEYLLEKSLQAAYRAPLVNTALYTPQNLEVVMARILVLDDKRASVIAQVVNPNPEISAYSLTYEFVLKSEQGREVGKISGENYISARESKFILEPLVVTAEPQAAAIELKLSDIRWTIKKPEDLKLEVLQKNIGQTLEGNFFAEGLVKNLQGFGLKKVQVQAVVFDASNQNMIAANETVLTELLPFESRYFRMIWPKNYQNIGQVHLAASVNLLDPGLILEEAEPVPLR